MPSVLKSTSIIQGSYTNTTYYDKYSFLTGQAIETRTVSSNGIEYKTKNIPAHQIESYVDNTNGYSMGSKVDNPTNKNMLTQTAATLTQIKKDEEWKTINADIMSWNNDWTYHNYDGETNTPINAAEKIWRKHQTFAWKGDVDEDGGYIGYVDDDDGFNWNNPNNQTNTKWINTSTTTLYDHYSMPLETIDINQNQASTKMTVDDCKIASVANAAYMEQYYAGAEDILEEDSDYIAHGIQGGAYQDNTKSHTGTKSLKLNAGSEGFKIELPEDLEREEDYKISVWVDKLNASNARIYINDEIKTFNGEQITAGDWTLLNHYEDLSSGAETIYLTAASGTIYADDFRMLPVESSMTSYVYNEWDELSYIIGVNNLATKFEYDSAGRLIKTYSEVTNDNGITGGFKLIKDIKYNYKKVAEVDANGNGEIDPIEMYSPLQMSLYINDSDFVFAAIANGIGGSGNYEYRWVESDSEIQADPNYSSWGSANERLISGIICGQITYVQCQVRDMETGAIVTRNTSEIKSCSSDDPILTPN